jgi:hypothetical protein
VRLLDFSLGFPLLMSSISPAYAGSDFPSRFDAPDSIAEMTFGESTIFDLDSPHAAHLWNSIRPNVHLGYVRLGEEDRLLVVSLYHALHCLTIFRRALVQDASLSDHHFEHCLNYLRQLLLCSADATLEPIDFRPVNHSFVSPSYNRQCRDWSAVFAAVDDNYSNWISGANHSAGLAHSSQSFARDVNC